MTDVLAYEAAVGQLVRLGYDRTLAEREVGKQHPELVPSVPVRDSRVLEKAEQVEIRKLALAFGFKVKNLSQYRPAKVSLGFPDLLLIHKRRPLMLWWETKRQVGGELSPAQDEFRQDCIRCDERHGYGDRFAFVDRLLLIGLAVPGAGTYGIEPAA